MAETTTLLYESNKYAIKIDNFEGPLDLLLHLIEKNKMDIFDIKISEITDQYIDYINKMQEMNLEVASEFLVMASILILLKSKKILPNVVDDEQEITEEELLRRIIEYKKYKEVSQELKLGYDDSQIRYFRMQENIELPKQELNTKYGMEDIVKAYKGIVKVNKEKKNENAKNIEKIAITDTYTVASKVKQMLNILIKRPKFIFNSIYSISKCNREEVVTAFSGLLELSRRARVTTIQEETFGNITVQKAKDIDNADDISDITSIE